MWWELISFMGIMALGQMVPGPDWVLVTRSAVRHGFRVAAWTAGGICCGLMVHAAVAVGGLSVYLRQSDAMWGVLRLLAAGYLVWVAFCIVRDAGVEADVEVRREVGAGRPFLQGLVCNLLNAKVCLLLAAVCAPYLKGGKPEYWPVLLWGVVVIQGLVLWLLWAALLTRHGMVRGVLTRHRRSLDFAFAGGLVLLALRLLWENS